MSDNSAFPDPVYRDTVLEPLFEAAKAHFAESMQAINRAHLVMLAETNILSAAQAAAIAGALTDIDTDDKLNELEFTGEFEDYFFLVEAELAKRLGADLAGALHTARSRNDIDHTVFKMELMRRLDTLLHLGHSLAMAVIDTAAREAGTLIVAYTHGQPAQPTTFGHYLAAMIEVLLRDLERLHDAGSALEKCPMGAAAITTTGFAVDRNRMADLLGFSEPLQNSYGCIASVDYVTGLYSAVKLLFLHIGRVVQDFQFWSSFEVGQLHVPDKFVQISSIMAQKRNPVPIEHLRLLSSLTTGRCDMVVNTMHNTPFTDMNDSEGEVQQAGYAVFESGGRVLALLAAFVPALTIRGDRVRRNSDAGCITITELADVLVREEALSFRQAHEIASITARDVLAKDSTLSNGFVAFTAAFSASVGRASILTEADYARTVSCENFIAVRNGFGGPASVPMRAALDGYRSKLAKLETRVKNGKTRRTNADVALAAAFAGLTETRKDAELGHRST